MSIPFQDSETAKNLLRAFAGESQARNRYDFAANLCQKQELQAMAAGDPIDRDIQPCRYCLRL